MQIASSRVQLQLQVYPQGLQGSRGALRHLNVPRGAGAVHYCSCRST